jgi:hypothetical protein
VRLLEKKTVSVSASMDEVRRDGKKDGAIKGVTALEPVLIIIARQLM